MLYPIQQKDLYLHPWFTLFGDLRSGLESKQRFYVIGYAFNDKFVRNAFEEVLYKDKILLIIDPMAEQIRNKFDKLVHEKIDVLPVKFGDNLFERQFTDYLDKIKTILIRFNTNHHQLSRCVLRVKSNCRICKGGILNNDNELSMEVRSRESTGGTPHMEFQVDNPNKADIKLELEIRYFYGDEIKLEVSDGTEQPNFSVEYGSNYDGVDSGRYVIARGPIPAAKISDGTFWTSPIILDEAQLFPDRVYT